MTVKFIRAVAIGFIVLFSFCAVTRSETKCKSKEECYKQYSKKGKAYFEKDDYKNAISYFLKALNEKPNSAVVMTYLGICYCKTGKVEDSVDLLNQAIEISPNAPEARIAKKWIDVCTPEPPPPDAPEGMVFIPAGEFWLGCMPEDNECQDDEKPQVKLYVDQFYMDKYEVTQGDYKRVMGSNPSHFSNCGDDCPVESVTWDEAKIYCGKGGKRLPTEAEWEFAARGGTKTKYYWGVNMNVAYAWYWDNSLVSYSGSFEGKGTHPIGQKKPNGYGLYDMAGNVWEWVEDCYDEGWYGKLNNGSQHQLNKCVDSGGYRVLRGGSWGDDAVTLRVSDRDGIYPGYRFVYIGFRCAQDLIKIP